MAIDVGKDILKGITGFALPIWDIMHRLFTIIFFASEPCVIYTDTYVPVDESSNTLPKGDVAKKSWMYIRKEGDKLSVQFKGETKLREYVRTECVIMVTRITSDELSDLKSEIIDTCYINSISYDSKPDDSLETGIDFLKSGNITMYNMYEQKAKKRRSNGGRPRVQIIANSSQGVKIMGYVPQQPDPTKITRSQEFKIQARSATHEISTKLRSKEVEIKKYRKPPFYVIKQSQSRFIGTKRRPFYYNKCTKLRENLKAQLHETVRIRTTVEHNGVKNGTAIRAAPSAKCYNTKGDDYEKHTPPFETINHSRQSLEKFVNSEFVTVPFLRNGISSDNFMLETHGKMEARKKMVYVIPESVAVKPPDSDDAVPNSANTSSYIPKEDNPITSIPVTVDQEACQEQISTEQITIIRKMAQRDSISTNTIGEDANIARRDTQNTLIQSSTRPRWNMKSTNRRVEEYARLRHSSKMRGFFDAMHHKNTNSAIYSIFLRRTPKFTRKKHSKLGLPLIKQTQTLRIITKKRNLYHTKYALIRVIVTDQLCKLATSFLPQRKRKNKIQIIGKQLQPLDTALNKPPVTQKHKKIDFTQIKRTQSWRTITKKHSLHHTKHARLRAILADQLRKFAPISVSSQQKRKYKIQAIDKQLQPVNTAIDNSFVTQQILSTEEVMSRIMITTEYRVSRSSYENCMRRSDMQVEDNHNQIVRRRRTHEVTLRADSVPIPSVPRWTAAVGQIYNFILQTVHQTDIQQIQVLQEVHIPATVYQFYINTLRVVDQNCHESRIVQPLHNSIRRRFGGRLLPTTISGLYVESRQTFEAFEGGQMYDIVRQDYLQADYNENRRAAIHATATVILPLFEVPVAGDDVIPVPVLMLRVMAVPNDVLGGY